MTKQRIKRNHELFLQQFKGGMTLAEIGKIAGISGPLVRNYLVYHYADEYLPLAAQRMQEKQRSSVSRINEVFAYLVGYKRKYGGSNPPIRQIVTNTSHVSTSMVARDLEALEVQGRLKLELIDGKKYREIVLGKWTYNGAE